MGRSPHAFRQQVAQLAIVFVPLALGLALRRMLCSRGLLFRPFVFCYYVAFVILAISAVVAVVPRGTLRKRALAACWIIVALVLLSVRFQSPYLFHGYCLDVGPAVFAYDGGLGTWFWIFIHAVGYAVATRLYATGRPALSVLFSITWALATMSLLSNGPCGGDELGYRWRAM